MTRDELEMHMLHKLTDATPGHVCTVSLSRESSEVSPGYIRVVLEYPPSTTSPRSVTLGTVEHDVTFRIVPASVKKLWADGNRESGTLSAVFALGWVEPHVTWSSDLGWRVTDAGKKAGLK